MTIHELKCIVEKDLSLTKKAMNDGDDPLFDYHSGRADALTFIIACLNLVD